MALRRNAPLFPAVEEDLAALSVFVAERGLRGVDARWREVVREYADERSYLSLYLATEPGLVGPTVRIEFGVQDGVDRHATGGFVGGWARATMEIVAVHVVLLDGRPAEMARFIDRLQSLASLELVASDDVVDALAA